MLEDDFACSLLLKASRSLSPNALHLRADTLFFSDRELIIFPSTENTQIALIKSREGWVYNMRYIAQIRERTITSGSLSI